MDSTHIRDARFDTKRRGYDSSAVDALLAWVAEQLDAGTPPSAAALSRVRFDVGRKGYDCAQVDGFLADLSTALQ